MNRLSIYNFFLISLSAGCYALSFPDFNLWYLAFFSLIPLLIVLRRISVKGGFVAGALFGTISGILSFYWVTVAMSVYGGIPWAMSVILLIALALIVGTIFFAPMTACLSFFNSKGIRPVLIAAPLWVTFEYLKTYIFTGFPWNLFGYSQLKFLKVVQIADITGVYGVSFLIVLINSLLYEIYINFFEQRRFAWKSAFITLVLFFSAIIYGSYQEKRWQTLIEKGRPLRFGLVQGNINQDQKWDKAYQDETMRIYTELSDEAFRKGAEIVIWPETATPFYFQSSSQYRKQVLNLAIRHNGWLIFGSPAYSYKKGKLHLYNSAFAITPDGEVSGRYDKIHLVPFGEYVPLKKILFFVEKLVPAAGDFSSGDDLVLLTASGLKIGMSICYEIIFPDQVRRSVKNGADILVTITNDAWFGRTSAPYQHFAMAVFRAIENRRPLLRAANTGITGYADQRGKILASTEIFKTTYVNGEIRITEEKSFYSEYGDIFSFLCIAFVMAICLYTVLIKKR